MAKFRTFTRTWWADRKCTKAHAGRKFRTGHVFDSEADAREHCRAANAMRADKYAGIHRGPRGLCTEYETI